jgi:hypothetical protein
MMAGFSVVIQFLAVILIEAVYRGQCFVIKADVEYRKLPRGLMNTKGVEQQRHHEKFARVFPHVEQSTNVHRRRKTQEIERKLFSNTAT